jgi:signal transduction histidine kinase
MNYAYQGLAENRSMKFGIRFRLTALAVASVLMGALIVLVTLTSQRQSEEAKNRLGQMDLESFRIADRFKEKLRFANDKMRRYASVRDLAGWDEYLKASEGLQSWIEEQAPLLTTPHEREILKKMESARQAYVQKAQEVHQMMEKAQEAGVSLAEYNGFQEQARRFLDLSQDLARAHYESRNEMLAHAIRTFSQLRLSVLALVALLFVFGTMLGMLVYRQLIAPLRVKLVESQALIERHEKLASLGMLAAGVAHEVRTPLTALKTALFIQHKRFQPGSAEHADALVIERELTRLERVVNDFLQFARPAEPQLGPLSADYPLQEVQSLLASRLARDDISLLVEDSPPMTINADSAQIQQVIINLVQNAADSIKKSGTITLRARSARKRISNGESDVVILEVADTGKGIRPEIEKRLFDPFFTTKATGTGLGLSIAARIVQKHGGTLQYQTQVNRGTTFGVVLPKLN